MSYENRRIGTAIIRTALKPEISEKGQQVSFLFVSFCVMVEDQKESLWDRRSYFVCICRTCVNRASTKRKIIFLVVSVCQIKSRVSLYSPIFYSVSQWDFQAQNSNGSEPKLSRKSRRNLPLPQKV